MAAGVYDPLFNGDESAGQAFTPEALSAEANQDAVRARHPEWMEQNIRWRWLLDSLEGGERYRQAVYGYDWRGMPIRNLIRHKREYPEPREVGAIGPYSAQPVGSDQSMPATDDDYELRRARTPIPTFVAETIGTYLGKIFSRKVKREIPDSPDFAGIKAWHQDADGKGTGVDSFMNSTVGRILLAVGNVDVLLCHPTPPAGEEIRSHADELRLNVFGCVARVILSQNLTYWSLDSRGCYTLAVVQEWSAGGDSDPRYRLGQVGPMVPFGAAQSLYRPKSRYRVWTPDRWVLYDDVGNKVDESDHPFGVVPIVRLFCRRKPRCENVGQTDLESIAERQREYYNRDSELILSDVLQAHPLVQAPEDYILADVEIPMGPGYILPKKKDTGGGAATYEGWDVLEYPKGGAESIRANKGDIRDDVDRDAGLTKPAGAPGSNGSTVAQSGVSKEMDLDTLHNRLCSVSKILEEAENRLVAMAQIVIHDGKPPRPNPDGSSKVEIEYPTQFHLNAPDQIATAATDFQTILAAAGECPEAETHFLCELFRKALPGMDDEDYDEVAEEIHEAVLEKAKSKEAEAEATPTPTKLPATTDPTDPYPDPVDPMTEDDPEDPTGEADGESDPQPEASTNGPR